MHDTIFIRLKNCIDRVLAYETNPLEKDMSFKDDLEMESLQLVTLQVEIEDEFNIAFDPLEDDFFEIFQTVDSLYNTIGRKLS